MFNVDKKRLLILIVILAAALYYSFVYNAGTPSLGIYLAESGEMVISEQHIETYEWNSHTIELNEAGIERWNSFITYGGIPKLGGTLYNKDFVLKIGEREIYSGKFYSLVSSMSYDGVVILDALMKLDADRRTIQINYGYPSPLDTADDPRWSPEVHDFLASKGLLKE